MKSKFIKVQSIILLWMMLIAPVSYADDILNLKNECKSYYVIENNSGQVLLDYNSDKDFEIASLTKLMTFSIVMDQVKAHKLALTDTVKIDKKSSEMPGSTMLLKEDEVLTVNDLLKGLIVVSGNDAAHALATKVAGSEKAFVDLMNKKAKEIGITTHTFKNASGYPLEDGTENKMSSKDLALLSTYLLKTYPTIMNYSKMLRLDMPERNFTKESTIPLLTTVKGVNGLKTGTTDNAGYSLITTMNLKNNPNHQIIAVLMGTHSVKQRNEIQAKVLNYVADRYKPRKILDKNKIYTSTVINSANPRVIGLKPKKSIDVLYNADQGLYTEIEMKPAIKAPIKKGETIGQVTIMVGDKGKEIVDLVADKDYKKTNVFERTKRSLGYTFRLIRKLIHV